MEGSLESKDYFTLSLESQLKNERYDQDKFYGIVDVSIKMVGDTASISITKIRVTFVDTLSKIGK